jgi:hypothetical protein
MAAVMIAQARLDEMMTMSRILVDSMARIALFLVLIAMLVQHRSQQRESSRRLQFGWQRPRKPSPLLLPVRPQTPARRKTMRLGIILAGLLLAGIALSTPAMAHGNTMGRANAVEGAVSQSRLQAPIGHRQPRPEDLPPGIVYDHSKTPAERALDRRLIICRC